MATEIFSLWGGHSARLYHRQGKYHVSAVIGQRGIWYVGSDLNQLKNEFNRACRRVVLRRFWPFMAPPPARLSV